MLNKTQKIIDETYSRALRYGFKNCYRQIPFCSDSIIAKAKKAGLTSYNPTNIGKDFDYVKKRYLELGYGSNVEHAVLCLIGYSHEAVHIERQKRGLVKQQNALKSLFNKLIINNDKKARNTFSPELDVDRNKPASESNYLGNSITDSNIERNKPNQLDQELLAYIHKFDIDESIKIKKPEFTPRISNSLNRVDVFTIKDLKEYLAFCSLAKVKNFGVNSYVELKKCIQIILNKNKQNIIADDLEPNLSPLEKGNHGNKEILDIYQDYLTLGSKTEVAIKRNISYQNVLNKLKKGEELGLFTLIPESLIRDKKRMMNMYNQWEGGATLQEIANENEISRQRVQQILTKGNNLGYFDYPKQREYQDKKADKAKNIFKYTSAKEVLDIISGCQSKTEVIKLLGIDKENYNDFFNHYAIDIDTLIKAKEKVSIYQKYIEMLKHSEFSNISSHVLQKHHQYLYLQILKYWGGINNFRIYVKEQENQSIKDTNGIELTNDMFLFDIVVGVLSSHFPNGFRANSPIELLRFRSFSTKEFGNDLSITDEVLMKLIISCGIFFEGKVYVITSETENKIQQHIDSIISSGAEHIFYNSFYEQHEKWLFDGSVISEKMLKDLLFNLYPKYIHKTNYFSLNSANSSAELADIENEIKRVWGNDVILSYEKLSERLPYIPFEKIKCVLAQNSDFIWNYREVYTHISKFDIIEDESVAIIDFVTSAYQTNGYASLSDVPLGEIEVRNPELTLTAIHNAIFRIVLSDMYDRHAKIITRKGDILDALTIIKEHCCTLEKCSLQYLLDYERELTGESHRWIPMEAGYSVMIRNDEDSFIAEKYVHFDATKIDNALDHFVTGEYLPLKGVTTFAMLPHCGQIWNLFLLESYCRRFSAKYRFDVLAVNSKNAGAIVRKSCHLSYHQIMADAVAKSNIPLEKVTIEDFLFDKGFLGRRSYAKANDLIEVVKITKEKKD